MPTRVVTLSHATGAGGETIGRTVAKALGFRYIDEEIINLAAQKEGIDAAVVADAERRKTFLARLLASLGDPPMIERELPTHYDLVINTDALSADEAADIVLAAARRRA